MPNRKETRELSKLRAKANSPNVAKLVPLGNKRSSLALVSPELSYAEKLKGGNISEPKDKEDKEEEEGKREEGDKKEGDEEEKEEGDKEKERKNDDDSPDDDDSSNGPNSNMAALLAPFDLDLTHVLTIVCGFERSSNPVKAVKEFGITSFEDFRSTDYDQQWTYQDNTNSTLTITGNNAQILSAIIAYARDLETQGDQEKDTPQNWTKESFGLWRRNEWGKWRNSVATTAASGALTNNSSTGAIATAGDGRIKLTDFNKTPKSEKDYEMLKNDEYFFGWKKKFERKAQLHKYKRILESTFNDTETHRLTLTIGSHDLELFDDQVNFLSIVFEYVLRTIKGRDLVQIYPTDPIQLWKKLLYHHRGSDASTEASSRLLQRLSTISIVISHHHDHCSYRNMPKSLNITTKQTRRPCNQI